MPMCEMCLKPTFHCICHADRAGKLVKPKKRISSKIHKDQSHIPMPEEEEPDFLNSAEEVEEVEDLDNEIDKLERELLGEEDEEAPLDEFNSSKKKMIKPKIVTTPTPPEAHNIVPVLSPAVLDVPEVHPAAILPAAGAFFYSQHDPIYEGINLPNTKYSIHGYGCFVMSLATLFQADPLAILEIPGAFDQDGLLRPGVIAEACGGQYIGKTPPGSKLKAHGWQIGETDFYKNKGFKSHFFVVNFDTKQQIDPLKFPAVMEPLSYPITTIRVFTGSAL